jgi:hypothetical protein
MMDIAVAASSTFRLQRRSGLKIDTGKRGNWCDDIGPPSAEIKGSATHGTPNTVAKHFWNQKIECSIGISPY